MTRHHGFQIQESEAAHRGGAGIVAGRSKRHRCHLCNSFRPSEASHGRHMVSVEGSVLGAQSRVFCPPAAGASEQGGVLGEDRRICSAGAHSAAAAALGRDERARFVVEPNGGGAEKAAMSFAPVSCAGPRACRHSDRKHTAPRHTFSSLRLPDVDLGGRARRTRTSNHHTCFTTEPTHSLRQKTRTARWPP